MLAQFFDFGELNVLLNIVTLFVLAAAGYFAAKSARNKDATAQADRIIALQAKEIELRDGEIAHAKNLAETIQGERDIINSRVIELEKQTNLTPLMEQVVAVMHSMQTQGAEAAERFGVAMDRLAEHDDAVRQLHAQHEQRAQERHEAVLPILAGIAANMEQQTRALKKLNGKD